ncbi:MAG: DNA topoisomerase (ATP-hydrolyzing) subunit B [Coriobacteriales bacterium]|jgi:DNA gyrase subunit B|nr:DNA topoisomerase (ATP-hydrolyzing) subunit B [Coriobacteriales bacterium]
MPKNSLKSTSYDENDIQILEGLEAVRKRPGMYIGSTGPRGLHHLVYEVVDNCIDEAMAGYATKVDVTIHQDNSVTVIDNGRGIPVGKHPKAKIPTLEVVLTVLHAGGKFGGEGYKVSGGLHGVGISVVNALSTRLEAEVYRDGYTWNIACERGKTVEKMSKGAATKKTGTKITFWADPEIFETTVYDDDTLEARMREMAFLNKGVKITYTDERKAGEAEERDAEGKLVSPSTMNKEGFYEETFHFEGGIVDFVKYVNEGRDVLDGLSKPIYFDGVQEGVGEVEMALQWNSTHYESTLAFANNIHTTEGGTHVEGFRTGLTSVLNKYARAHDKLKEKEDNMSGDDVRSGLACILSVKLREPQFEGQTKTKLGNTSMKALVQSAVTQGLSEYLEEHPNQANTIIKKALEEKRVREAVNKYKQTQRKAKVDAGLPGKLAKCTVKDPELTEVFIVEGDSAGGSAKQARTKETQAILPLRGKILNIERVNLHRALSSDTINTLITALGTGIGEDFDIEKARYHKVIIMTDADVDGAHIRILLLTFFFRFMPKMIEAGYIYIAQPPLYRLQVGKKKQYLFSDAALASETAKVAEGSKYTIQRYKGLGEMDPEQLWETTMQPTSRTLLRVTMDDALAAEKAVSDLMGDSVPARKSFIQKYAKEVKFLDA